MSITLGVDAGGSSTTVALAEDGRVVATHEGPAGNASLLGAEAVSEAILQTSAAVLNGALPDAVFAGVAGAARDEVAREIRDALQSRFPNARIAVRDDAFIALRAAVSQGDGAVLIAGTGSIAYAQREGIEYRCGGYGVLLGDEGSGFAIGSAALNVLLRSFDGRGAVDAFSTRLAAHLEVASANDVLAHIYGSTHPAARIASLAPVVIDAANSGERRANTIVQRAALDLAELAKALIARAGLTDGNAPLVFAGSLLQRNSLLTFLLETRLSNDLPHVPLHKEPVEPWMGALAQAQGLL